MPAFHEFPLGTINGRVQLQVQGPIPRAFMLHRKWNERSTGGAHIGKDSPHRDSCSSSSDIDSPSENDYSFSGTFFDGHKHCSRLQPLRGLGQRSVAEDIE